jgi:hypothetical protein
MSTVFYRRFDLCDELTIFNQIEDENYDCEPDDLDLDLSDAGDEKTVLD